MDARFLLGTTPDVRAVQRHARRGHTLGQDRLVHVPHPADMDVCRHPVRGWAVRSGGHRSRLPPRGLVRTQFKVLHAKSEAMGHLVQSITGIPWYYRQFGYEYALDLDGGPLTCATSIPALKEGETEPHRLRPMTQDDLPLVKTLYKRDSARSMVACLRPDWLWHAMLDWYSPDSFERRHFQIIETAEGCAVGYVVPTVRCGTTCS